jgi:hypothetical protein
MCLLIGDRCWRALCLSLVLALSACGFASPASPGQAGLPMTARAAGTATPTPFQPSAPTATTARTPTPENSPTPAPPALQNGYWFYGFDLSDTSQTVRLSIMQRNASLNFGHALELAFRPGWPCEFGDQRACLSLHGGGRWLLATVHSGIGGEAEALRRALEGTGLNQAAFSLETVQSLLDSLPGTPVYLWQGGDRAGERASLQVLAAVRIPAGKVEAYYRLPVDAALARAAEDNPSLAQALSSGQPLLIIETCGWRHPQDPRVPGLPDTSASVYLVVIGGT